MRIELGEGFEYLGKMQVLWVHFYLTSRKKEKIYKSEMGEYLNFYWEKYITKFSQIVKQE